MIKGIIMDLMMRSIDCGWDGLEWRRSSGLSYGLTCRWGPSRMCSSSDRLVSFARSRSLEGLPSFFVPDDACVHTPICGHAYEGHKDPIESKVCLIRLLSQFQCHDSSSQPSTTPPNQRTAVTDDEHTQAASWRPRRRSTRRSR